MAVIGRGELLGFAKRRYREVPVPWIGPDAVVRIQSLTEGERSAIERAIGSDGVSTRVQMILAAVVDDAGHRIFSDEHAATLQDMDAQVIAGLVDAISEHCDCNGDRLKQVKGEVKN